MNELRKVLITIPDSLLSEVDSVAESMSVSRSRLVRDAMKLYIKESRNNRIREQLVDGYKSMAKINSELARVCVEADNQVLSRYEQKLAESE